jgi:hypothetical protein
MFIPDPGPEFFHPGSRIQVKKIRIPDPDPHQRIKVFLNLKTVSKLSEKFSGMLIPDPGFVPSRIPNLDPGVKKAPDPDPQHCFFIYLHHV